MYPGHIDFLGKIQELNEMQEDEMKMFQLSEYSVLDEKTGKIYISDDLGRMGEFHVSGNAHGFAVTNGGKIVRDLINNDQYDALNDFINVVLELDFDGGMN